jgi:uncharacterized protein (DUF1810 family)
MSHDLGRFIAAQHHAFDSALEELRLGRKQGHWMWFVFPQIAGLGSSVMAEHYAIHSLEEAKAYVRDPYLGGRLRACVEAVNEVDGRSASEIFGWPDELKFRSSLTLFAAAAPDEPVFGEALKKFFGGEPDPLTLERLAN